VPEEITNVIVDPPVLLSQVMPVESVKRGRRKKEPDVALVQEPDVALVQEPDVALVQQPVVVSVQEPVVVSVQQPVVVSVQEPDVALVQQPVVVSVQQPEASQVVSAPKTRGRAKKPVVEPIPEAPKAKSRGRPKKIVEPIPQAVVVKARGRKPNQIKPELLEGFSDPDMLKTKSAALNPETLEVIPEAPIAKKLVRLRREAKEHVFSYQGALYNPYEALLEHFRATPNGLNSRELATDLDDALLERLGGRKGLEDAVASLERTGYLIAPKRGIFQPSREFIPIVGRLEVRSDGSGWFTPDTPGLRAMLIPSASLLFAWHDDRVVARELRRNGQSEGEVIRVLERARSTLTGTLEYKRGYALLRPDETHLPSIAIEASGLSAGTRLVADILYPEDTGEDEALARVKSVLGDASSIEAERAAVITRFALPEVFAPEALKELGKLGIITAKDLKGRIDLRGKRVYALPSLELALQIEPLGNGNVLLAIHYADAPHWIDEGTALEKAMFERGAACDLSGIPLPLFPNALLNAMQFQANTERLSLSVLIETSSNGDLVNYVVRPSVVGVVAMLKDATELEQNLIKQIGGLDQALTLATRLCATAIAASDVTALYRVAGSTSPELPSALERSSGFDPASIVIRTLHQKLIQPSTLQAIHSSAASQGLGLQNPLSKAADFINIRILCWCATKLSQRKRENLLENLPSLATNLQRLEQRAENAKRNLEQFQLIKNLNQTYPMRGVVIGINEFALEIVLENGAIGKLTLEDLGEEATFTPHQWKTRLGRVFKPGSIVRVVVEKTRPATREAQLVLHQKESHMSRLRRRKPGANASSTATGAKPSVGKTITRRGVVVLGNRPRAEYPRPVRITARKLYFGEWSREKFVELEGENPEFEIGQRPAPRHNPRPLPKGNAEIRRPNEPRHAGTEPRPARVENNPNQRRSQQTPRPENTVAPSAPQRRPAHVPAAQPDTSRNSRIEALRQRQMQALERNANRAQNAPAPIPSPAPVVLEPEVTSKPAYQSRRRPNRSKTPAA
jgi:exoribonuclease R